MRRTFVERLAPNRNRQMKSKQIADVVNEDSWAIAEGDHEGKPVLVRFRHKLRNVTDVSGYPQLLQITWPYEEADESGMPEAEDSNAMELFEEHMIAAFEHDQHAVLTAVITTDGVRQWIIYTGDLEECGKRLSAMPHEQDEYPIELVADDDPEWEFLREEILAGCDDVEDDSAN